MLAERLAAGEIVVLHFDGDCRFSELAGSENLRQYQERVVAPIAELLRQRGMPAHAINGLWPLIPTWELEAWLYAATPEAAEALHDRIASASQASLLAAWDANPGLLDEVPHPKDLLEIGSTANATLAAALPVQGLLNANGSFHLSFQVGRAVLAAQKRSD